MINKLTGMPVSEETKDVLKHLAAGAQISYDEIEKLPEIQEAYSCVTNAIPTVHLQNRENIQLGVLTKLSELGSATIDSNGKVDYNGIVGRDNRVDIVIGLPASGKSSALVDPLSQEFKSRVIDSDMAKELLPEFNGGWGAGVVHKESKLIIDTLKDNAIDNGENIIYPIVGSNPDKVMKSILEFKTAGYDVYLHFNELAPEKALGRMINRFFESGRFLDPKLIAIYGNKPHETFNYLKGAYTYESREQNAGIINDNTGNGTKLRRNGIISNGMETRSSSRIEENDFGRKSQSTEPGFEGRRTYLISGYSHWQNDVPRGERPHLIETNCKGKVFEQGVCEHYQRELTNNGFHPSVRILNACLQLQHSTNTLYSLKDICNLYKHPDLSLSKDAAASIQQIGDLCKGQELQRCPSFQCHDVDCPEL